MIERSIIFLAITATYYTLAFQCPTNTQTCICQPGSRGGYEISCDTENNAAFIVYIQLTLSVTISCQFSPRWKNFLLNSTLPGKEVNEFSFHMCGLPENDDNKSLKDVVKQLGIEKINRLHFQSDRILNDQLTRQQLEGFSDVTRLELPSSGLSNISSDVFSNFPNLTLLNLHDNNLILPLGIFDNLPKLRALELGNNGMKKLDVGIFDKLENLNLLNIWNNELSEIEPGLFDKLVSLTSLDIHTNKLTTLHPNIFSKLKKLQDITLYGNNYSSLPEGLFKENTELSYIKLTDNGRNLTTLPPNFFANLTKLKKVDLSIMGLRVLPENIFWGASGIENLTLERNFLVTLPKHIFRDLKNLTILELMLNDIETLPDNIFANTRKLVRLDLSRNKMVSIPENLFNGLTFLKELNMEKNLLQTIDNMAFNNLYNLRVGRFSHNQLSFDSEDFDPLGPSSPFVKCNKLEELYLAYNNISDIYSDWLISDTKLKLLNLSHNEITFIRMSSLQFVSNDIKVDLTHNKINHIYLRGAEDHATFQDTPRNMQIFVENNPIICDCYLYDFLLYLDRRMHPNVYNYMQIIGENLTCESPEPLKNMKITSLKSKTWTCIDVEHMNSVLCPILRRPDDNTLIIDCSYRNLTEISFSETNKNKPNGSPIELNLIGNSLKEIPSTELLGSQHITILRLSHNNITDVPLEKLPENLKILELDNNNISTINPEVLDFLSNSTSLKKLTLHKNPWRCDCDDRDLLKFVQLKLVDMPDLLQVTCDGMNVTMSEMTVNEFCPVRTAMLVGISMAIALTGLFIGSLVALYYRYQREIKVWLYARQFCLWFVTEDELDKEKIYDAFISYSHKDEDFVVKNLVPKLESGPRPYKLCLHFRDWPIGEWIPNQITRSVEQSKRTIVIVSPNFLESVWGAMEFRAAHRQAMSEGRARVILILYGDIGPTNNLDAEFRAYLNMNTYVKWGDPWFWDKLRYALPHPPELMKRATKKKIFEKRYPCIQINDEKESIYPNGVPETPPAVTTPPADSLNVFVCDHNEKDFHTSIHENEVSKLNANNKRALVPQCEAIHKQLIDKIQCTTV